MINEIACSGGGSLLSNPMFVPRVVAHNICTIVIARMSASNSDNESPLPSRASQEMHSGHQHQSRPMFTVNDNQANQGPQDNKTSVQASLPIKVSHPLLLHPGFDMLHESQRFDGSAVAAAHHMGTSSLPPMWNSPLPGGVTDPATLSNIQGLYAQFLMQQRHSDHGKNSDMFTLLQNRLQEETSHRMIAQQTLLHAQHKSMALQRAYANLASQQVSANLRNDPMMLMQRAFHTSAPANPPSASLALSHVRAQEERLPSLQQNVPISTRTIVNFLGSTLRHNCNYVDVANLADLQRHCCDGDESKKGLETFPEKLHALLRSAVDDPELACIVSFAPHGRAFIVHDTKRFCEQVLPKHFNKLGQWKSFTRQLNLYGFSRMATGPDAGGYYHELFLRGRPYLCPYLKRVGVTQPGLDRRMKKIPANKKLAPGDEVLVPIFYNMPPIIE
jgi:hypothetical protein